MVITGLTRNQFAGNTARGFESHTLRQRITVISIQGNDGYFTIISRCFPTFELIKQRLAQFSEFQIVEELLIVDLLENRWITGVIVEILHYLYYITYKRWWFNVLFF